MRLLIANHTSEIVGGAEQYVSVVALALAQRGFEVRLLTEEAFNAVSDGSTFVAAAPGLERQVETWSPDLVFVQGLLDPRLEAWLVGQFRSVLFAHNYYGTCISGEKRHRNPRLRFCERSFGRACLALYFPLGCGPANAGVFLGGYRSQSARHQILNQYREIVGASAHMKAEFDRNTARPVTVAPLFSGPAAPEPTSSRHASRFAFVGRMTSAKGGHLAIEACASLQASLRESITLDFVGDGPDRARWEELARSRAVDARFHGWLGPEARDEVVRHACALVVPSIWPEPFGLVGLEAARLGVPAVAFDAGGIREWLEDDVTGALCAVEADLVASLTRGLSRAREDFTTRRKWGVGAHRSVGRFTLDRHVKALCEVFDRARGARA